MQNSAILSKKSQEVYLANVSDFSFKALVSSLGENAEIFSMKTQKAFLERFKKLFYEN